MRSKMSPFKLVRINWYKLYSIISLQDVTSSFIGCIANVKVDDEDVGVPVTQLGVQPCSSIRENGAYFYGESGYIKQGRMF